MHFRAEKRVTTWGFGESFTEEMHYLGFEG